MGTAQNVDVSPLPNPNPKPKFFPPPKICDFCKSSAALLFCRPHSAFLCLPCDVKLHHTEDKHGRLWICDVCENAPAAFNCKADAAVLCVACDRDIHCANPLANRHERLPVEPFYDSAAENVVMMKSTAVDFLGDGGGGGEMFEQNCYTPDSWISTPAAAKMLLQDSDQVFDFDNRHIYGDSVVPVQIKAPPVYASENRFEIDFTRPNIGSYNNCYNTQSISHSLSSSSMEVGVVPDGSSPSEASYPFTGNVNSGGNQGLDREARVLRYREKRKNRKFEKTIRYASRKAYAETRPRVKGRFAKRTDLDRIVGTGSADFIIDTGYGIVPSF